MIFSPYADDLAARLANLEHGCCSKLPPELAWSRALWYHREYEGLTLRETLGLGLPQPAWWK